MKITLVILALIGVACAKDWWENGNYYQIYPRSFKDSNGDGIGDLIGITEKLEYLKDIGMTAVWLSPIFKSPMVDFGYDISDYYKIHHEYGTNEDFDNLLKKAKEIGIKIILDFVPNHTSDEHEWFQKSIDKIEPYTDYYIWANPIIDEHGNRLPPSNWVSIFRNSAWEWNEKRQQYYLHQFAIKQPDLNYRNPNVLKELDNILKYWLDKGVDGFRIDAVPYFFETEPDMNGNYLNEPTNPLCPNPNDICHVERIYTKDLSENYDIVYHWRELCDQYTKDNGGETRIVMSEAYTSLDDTIKYYGDGIRNGSHIPFNFELIANTNNGSTNAIIISNTIDSWLDRMPEGVIANWVIGNHDTKRISTKFGKNRVDLINILMQTLPGNIVTYYGEELGMANVYIPWEKTIDPQACNADPALFEIFSRDPVRTPFQWDASPNSGFSTAAETWLPVAPDYRTNNVLMQLKAPISHLHVFKKLTQVRREPSFLDGSFDKKTIGNDILVYKREKSGSETYVVILNFGKTNQTINLKEQFPTIADQVEIITTSIHSQYTDGDVIDATVFVALADVGAVVKSQYHN